MAPGPAQSNLTAVETALQRAMPNWRAIAADPNWTRWVNTVNPATGHLRSDQLNDAINRGDVRSVVETMQRFVREQLEGWPIRAIDQGPQRAVIPSFTRDAIKRNYERHRRGEFAGREEEWTRLERSMHQAVKEGRVAGAVPLAKNFGDGQHGQFSDAG